MSPSTSFCDSRVLFRCSPWRMMLLLFAVALMARVGWVLVRYGDPVHVAQLTYPDEEAYWHVASSLASGGGLIDEFGFRATYMPLYPAFLAIWYHLPSPLLWARVVQAILGAAVAPLTFLLAARWCEQTSHRVCKEVFQGHAHEEGFDLDSTRPLSNGRGSEKAGGRRTSQTPAQWPTLLTYIPLIAGFAAAVDPFLIFFSGLLLTETLFAGTLLVVMVALFDAARMCRAKGGDRAKPKVGAWRWARQALWIGIWLCVCVYLRPSTAVLAFVLPVVLCFYCRWDRRVVLFSAGTILVVVLGLVPWAARNDATIGQWRWLTTRGGISLYDGLREGANGGSDLAHTRSMEAVAGLPEVQWDAWFREKAWADARSAPLQVLHLAGAKFCRTWSLAPHVAGYSQGLIAWVSRLWMIVVLVLAVVGWWYARSRPRALLLLLTPVAAVTLLHMVFVGSVRYRIPVMPMLLVVSATGACALLKSRGPRKRGSMDTTMRG